MRRRPSVTRALIVALGAVLPARAFSGLTRACTLFSRARSSPNEACCAGGRYPCARFHLGGAQPPFGLPRCRAHFHFPTSHRLFFARAQDNVPAMVMDGLWIGSIHAAFNQDSMQDRGITHVSQ